MRRSDREVCGLENLAAIIQKCDVCRIAMADEPAPYILPLNFGMEVVGGKVILYFHGASHGRKYELLAKNNRVAFEMDCGHELLFLQEEGNCTMNYESVIGSGVMEYVQEQEKEHAASVLMGQYRGEGFPYNKKVLPHTVFLKLTVERMTGKRRSHEQG